MALPDFRSDGVRRSTCFLLPAYLPQLRSWHGTCSLVHRQQMNDAERSRMAREKINRGELPRVNPQRIMLHPGTWERCALCGDSIAESEMAYELQFTLRLVSFWFHVACHAAWLEECATH
jgi:hypothetical protein